MQMSKPDNNQSRRGTLQLGLVAALVATLLLVPTVLAETKTFNGGQWVANTNYTTTNEGGATIYWATSYASASPSISWITVNTRGYNNSLYWHEIDQQSCSRTNAGSCTVPRTLFNSSQSGASQSYATSKHEFYQGSSEIPTLRDYTSIDLSSPPTNRSRQACWTTAGC